MQTITIDDKDYNLETLSESAKAELVSLQFVDQELVKLQRLVAALQTARNAYAAALRTHLPSE